MHLPVAYTLAVCDKWWTSVSLWQPHGLPSSPVADRRGDCLQTGTRVIKTFVNTRKLLSLIFTKADRVDLGYVAVFFRVSMHDKEAGTLFIWAVPMHTEHPVLGI